MSDYSDLINYNWTGSKTRPHMSTAQRAKIFMPFAALKGYEEAVEEKQKIEVSKSILSTDEKQKINFRLNEIGNKLEKKEHPMVRILYFEPSQKNDKMGQYNEISGIVASLRPYDKTITIVAKEIDFDNIKEIEILNY